MIELLLEGIESLRLPCSWVLLIPGAAVTLYGRRRPLRVISIFIAAATLVAWLRFGGWWFEVPRGGVQIAMGLAILAAALTAWRIDSGVTDVLAAGVTAIAATSAWIPCVGPHLGQLLNGSRTAPFAHVGGTIAFLAGQFLPLILIGAAGVLTPNAAQRLEHRWVIATGAFALAIVGLLFATTIFDDLASELARRSNDEVLSRSSN